MKHRWTHRPIAAALATFAVGAVLSAVIAGRQASRNDAAAAQHFTVQAQRVAYDIAVRLRTYEYGLRGARGAVLAAGVDRIDRKTFAIYSASRDLQREFPGARGIGVIRRVPERALAAFVAGARHAGRSTFSVREFAPHAGEHFVEQFLEPEASNADAIGVDVASEESRRTAALTSIRSGVATITKPLTLSQAPSAKGSGFLLLLPIFRPGASISSAADRDLATAGWSFAPLVIDDVLRDVSLRDGQLSLRLRDVSPGASTPFFASPGSEAPATKGLIRRVVIPVYGRIWEAEVRATPALWQGLDQVDPRVALAVCLSLTLLISVLAAFYARTAEREWQVRRAGEKMAMRDIADARTAERHVRELNATLEKQVLDRTALLDSARRDLQALLDATPLMIGYWDAHLKNRVANRAYADWFGLSSEVVRGRSFRDLLGENLFDANRPHAEAALRGTPQVFERSVPRPTGSGLLYAQVQYVPDVVDGEVRGFHVIAIDISELTESRLRLTAVLRENEALLRTIHQHEIVCVADPHGRIIDVNDSFCRISGYTREELLGESMYVKASGLMTLEAIEAMTRAISAGEAWRGEICTVTQDGSLHWVDAITSPFMDDEGRIEKIVSIRTDITTAKLLEQRLRSSEALLDRAGRVAGIGGWEMDLRTSVITWSAHTYRIHDVEPDYVPHLEGVLGFYPPEARALLSNAVNDGIVAGGSWDLEVPFVTAKGRQIWVRAVGAAELEDGKAVRLVGAMQDVSARKEAEASLAHERHLLTSLLDTVPDSIFFKDIHSRFLRINRALARRLGLDDPADAIGKSDEDFFTTDHTRAAAAIEQRIMTSEITVHDQEEQALWPDRPSTWSHLTRLPLHDLDGRVMGTFGVGRDITARKQMEMQLQRSNARMQVAADAAHLGVWEYDVSADSLSWDTRMFDIYGASPSSGALPYTIWSESLHPDDRVQAEREVAESIGDGKAFDAEFRIVRPDGEVRHIKAAALVARDEGGGPAYLTGVNLDVTDRRRAELELVETSSLLRTVLESASEVSVIATNPDRLITVFNRGAERLLGYSSAEVVGHATPSLMHDDAEVQARAVELTALLGRQVDVSSVFTEASSLSDPREWTYVRKNGSRVTVSLIVTAMQDEHGRILGYLGIAHDVTRQKEIERSLRSAMHTERQANQAKSQFLANMSHEIRTPLNAVIGLSYLLGKTALEPKQEMMLGKISIASKSLLSVINDVLDLSKIEAGELIIERVAFDVRALLAELSDVMSVNAEAKGVGYTLTVDPDVPDSIEGDPTRLGQILTNLVSNAIKFTEVGGVHLTAQRVTSALEATTLRFTVQDSGIGIALAAQARLFTPFAQADASTTRRFGGTGLGLSIVKRLASLMGGDVGVSSVPGAGSEFWVALPVGRVAPGSRVSDRASPVGTEAGGLAGLRILVVDDSDVNREVAQRIIELEGAVVVVLNDGQQAIDRLRATPGAFDAVLMDVQMPVLDGNEATRMIRDHLGLANLPIIALTAGAMLSERAQSTAAGMNAFVSKPFEPHVLVRTIREQVAAASVSRAVEVHHAPRPISPSRVRQCIEGIDHDRICKTLQDDPMLFESLVSRTLDEYRTLEVPIGPLDDAALADVRMRMHKLKGSSGTLGMMAVYRAAGDAEQACVVQDGARASLLVQTIVLELQVVRGAFLAARRTDAERGGKLPAPPDVTSDKTFALDLRALVAQLEEQNLDALENFREISPALRRRMGDEFFTGVCRQVETLDFEAAAAALARLAA